MFLRNAWYVAARDHEVTREPLARTILNEPVVMYRKEDGTAVAIEDRCCHRHLPLSLGYVDGDDIVCGYHGMKFDCAGQCIEVPGQKSVPRNATIQSYPIVEKWGWVWIWTGDPAKADESQMPRWWRAGDPSFHRSKGHYLYVNADYRLFNDNLLDITHLTYVHKTSIGASSITEFAADWEQEGREVTLTRWIEDRPPPPLYQSAGKFEGNVDRAQVVEYYAPCHTANHAIVSEAGTGRERGLDNPQLHLIALSAPTPETETTTHYFFTFLRGFALEDRELDKVTDVDFVKVFEEDVAVLNGQQRMMTLKPDANQVNIAVDAAPIAARRILQGLIDDENKIAQAAE